MAPQWVSWAAAATSAVVAHLRVVGAAKGRSVYQAFYLALLVKHWLSLVQFGMQSSSTEDPPPPPFPPDEPDLDALPEGVEYLGTYPSLAAYVRTLLEPEVSRGAAWILDYLDYDAVLGRFEGGIFDYFWAGGHVFRAPCPVEHEAE
jgi:hypothetical protein